MEKRKHHRSSHHNKCIDYFENNEKPLRTSRSTSKVNIQEHNMVLVKSIEKLLNINNEQNEKIKRLELKLDETQKNLDDKIKLLSSKVELLKIHAEAEQDLYQYMIDNRFQIGNDHPLTKLEFESLIEQCKKKNIRY